jgi:amino acid transporter
MGERADLPRWFAKVSVRHHTPVNSILFLAAAAAALAITGSFVWLAVVSTLARMFVYAVTIAALPRAPERPPLNAWHWISGAVGIAICAWAAAQADSKAWLTLGALAVAGGLLFVLTSAAQRIASR